MTDALAAFLRARLDERETVALAAGGRSGMWTALGTGVYLAATADDDIPPLVTTGPEAGGSDEDAARAGHIALHDPERVLREIQALRTTVDAYDIALGAEADDGRAAYRRGHRDALREACLRLATPYASHPGYGQAVAPGQG